MSLYGDEGAARKAAKEAKEKLDAATLARYGELSRSDVQHLVINHKWGTVIDDRIRVEVAGLIERLIERLHELGERYDSTLSDIQNEVDALAIVVEQHLAQMGVR